MKIYLSVGEQEMVKGLQVTGASLIEATNCVIDHKMRLLAHYESIGYTEMCNQLRKELGIE